ncbi:MAG: methyltransferase domain-containing protein [Hyphomicrobiaceae bacterium]
MTANPEIFDRALLTKRLQRAAPKAHAHDFLLHRVADDFAERLSVVQRKFPFALNLGAYHGVVSRELAKAETVGEIIDFEHAEALLRACPGPRIRGDMELLPFSGGTLDLVVSGLALQLVNDLPGVLIQIVRALKPDGLFLGAMLGGATLHELRTAWAIAEEEVLGGASPRVVPFADLRDLGSLLQRAGFALPVVDGDVVHVRYSSSLALMREIKAMGASNMMLARHRKPVTKTLLARAAQVYDEQFGEPDGRVTATFEILYVTAWAPHESQQKPLQPGSAKMRLAEALGVEEKPAGEKAGR